MPLAPTADHFRAEIARHYLDRATICHTTGMNPNVLSMFIHGSRPLTGVAAHNIGYAINKATGLMIFDVDMSRGPQRSTLGRPPLKPVKITLPIKSRKKKRKKLRKPELGTYAVPGPPPSLIMR